MLGVVNVGSISSDSSTYSCSVYSPEGILRSQRNEELSKFFKTWRKGYHWESQGTDSI